jgi:erythronate-4-phosphate dehydrogenase
MPPPPIQELRLSTEGKSMTAILNETVKAMYEIEADDARLRKSAELPVEERGRYFDLLRQTYPIRREFQNTRIRISPRDPRATEIERILKGLGFR